MLAALLCGCGGAESRSGSVSASTSAASVESSAATAPKSGGKRGETTAVAGVTTNASPEPARPSRAKSESGAQADAICLRRHQELTATPLDPTTAGIAEVRVASTRRVAIEQRAADELARLTPPPGLARDWRRFLTYNRAQLQAALKLRDAARADDIDAIRSASSAPANLEFHLLAFASRVGASHCASP
jgi:hypothetical protein